jgi:hypothetical protein
MLKLFSSADFALYLIGEDKMVRAKAGHPFKNQTKSKEKEDSKERDVLLDNKMIVFPHRYIW